MNSLWRSNKGCFTPVSNHLKYKAIIKESLLEADGSEPMKWFKSNHIYELECTSQSANLNQIENLQQKKMPEQVFRLCLFPIVSFPDGFLEIMS